MNDSIPTQQAIHHERADTILEKEARPVRLKLSFLLPLAIVFFGLITTFVFLTFDRSQKHLARSTQQTLSAANSMFSLNILENSSMLEAVSHALVRNKAIEAALKAKDRSRLLSLSTPLFNELSKDHLITHFYYHGTDRVNLLRVHKPERFGDKINRFTMVESESIGSISSGIELGILGTFTLRHVMPWYDSNQKLIGYIELGMEIDSIFESIEQFYNVDLHMFINKKFLNKERWVEGMKMLGRKTGWDTLDQYVVTNLGEEETLPPEFLEQYEHAETILHEGFDFVLGKHEHQARFLPIDDKGKRNVGGMWLLIDIEDDIADSYKITLITSGISSVLGAILFVIFFRLVNGIESELEKHERALRHIATNDGLTGIYNRRSFDSIITNEFDRAKRYDRELTLLIIDIDHFKRVNDSFGHIAGDTVLRKIAEKLTGQLRTNDHLARYGGEEFAIILPETPLNIAHLVAERIRTSAGERDYKIDSGCSTPINLSIGISSFPTQAKTVEELILQADSALYKAKETGRNRVCDFHQDA